MSLPELLEPETLEPEVPCELLLGEVLVPDEDEVELSEPLLEVALLPLDGWVEELLELFGLEFVEVPELLWFGCE